MSKIDVSDARVMWPSRERATAFVSRDHLPFTNATIGITYPIADYEIKRDKSFNITVFEYVLDGEGEMLIDGEWHDVRAGDTYVMRAHENHHYRSKPKHPMTKIWINYAADYICPMLDAYGIRSGVYHSEGTAQHFGRLREYAERGADTPEANFAISDCLHAIIRAIAITAKEGQDDEYRIREALCAGVYGKLNLDELSARLHISKSQIIRTFKRSYDTTPYEYFLELKIDAAKILLRDTKMQIKEISEKLSICDEHYFSTLFHTRVGMTPRQYRSGKRVKE